MYIDLNYSISQLSKKFYIKKNRKKIQKKEFNKIYGIHRLHWVTGSNILLLGNPSETL